MLQDAYTGIIYADSTSALSVATAAGNFMIKVPESTPPGSNYLWSAYTYPDDAAAPYNARYGLDDTFNYNSGGSPTGPETIIKVISP